MLRRKKRRVGMRKLGKEKEVEEKRKKRREGKMDGKRLEYF